MSKDEIVEVEEVSAEEERSRPARKMTYTRRLKSELPPELVQHYAQQGWALRYKPYRVANIVQNSVIAELKRDGWEFVTAKELDDFEEGYSDYFDVEDFRGRSEILVAHDLVLMKAPVELVEAQKEYFREQANRELQSVDLNVLEKRGFNTRGSKSSVTHAEPRFKN
jgi:hypothetical protein